MVCWDLLGVNLFTLHCHHYLMSDIYPGMNIALFITIYSKLQHLCPSELNKYISFLYALIMFHVSLQQ